MDYQKLFTYLNKNLDVQLTQDEAYDIIEIAREIISNDNEDSEDKSN